MMMLAKISRRVVVPCAPTMGNMLLAKEAPDWIDAMAISSKPIGKRVAARLRGWVFISARRSLGGVGDEQYSAQLMGRVVALKRLRHKYFKTLKLRVDLLEGGPIMRTTPTR